MNGYSSVIQNGYESHPVGNGHIPNGYGSHSPRQGLVPNQGAYPLNKRKERIDWRKIASVNIDHLARSLDVGVLRDNISSIAYCDIEEEVDTRVVDQNFLKVFKMAQLIIQYLVHTQDYFTDTIKSLKEEGASRLQRDEEKQREVEVIREQLCKVKQESHKRKKLLKAQQNLIQSGVNNYHQCAFCPKAFTQGGFLQSHLLRKHPEHVSQQHHQQQESQSESRRMEEIRERLEGEMGELKDRLRSTQVQLEQEREQQKQMQEKRDKAELQAQEEAMVSQFTQWKEEQKSTHKAEMDQMQSLFMKELKDMHDNYSVSQAALEDLQSKLGKHSNLGALVDEDEVAEQRREQESRMRQMREEYEERLVDARQTMDEDRTDLERKWAGRMKEQKKRYNKDTKELRALLENMAKTLKKEQTGGSASEQRHRREVEEAVKKAKEYETKLKQKEKELHEVKQTKLTIEKPEAARPPRSPTPTRTKTPEPEPESESEEEEEDEGEELVESDELTKAKTMEAVRRQIDKVLQIRLEQKGVSQDTEGISNQSLETKMKQLKQERQTAAKKHSKFYDIRERLRRDLEERFKGGGKKGGRGKSAKVVTVVSGHQTAKSTSSSQSAYNTFPRSKVEPKSILSKPKEDERRRPVARSNSMPGSDPKRRKTPPPPVAPREERRPSPKLIRSMPVEERPGSSGQRSQRQPTATSTPKAHSRPRVPIPRVSFEVDKSDDDDDDESDEDLSEDEEEEEESEEESESADTPAPRPQPRQQPRQQPAPITIPGPNTNSNNAQGADLDDSDWDSEDISALDEVSPGKMQRQPAARPSTNSAKGPMVTELSRTIEAQLQNRHLNKKPAGGVDLGATAERGDSPSPRIPTIPDAGRDSDDSLAVSSLEGSVTSPTKRDTRNEPPANRFQPGPSSRSTDASNTYGTSVWGTSSNKAGASNHATGENSSIKGTNKSSLVSVTDFDDDDDFDLSDL